MELGFMKMTSDQQAAFAQFALSVMPRQRARPLAGPMTGSGGASSIHRRQRLLDRPLSQAMTTQEKHKA
jgi:hypothetical protein